MLELALARCTVNRSVVEVIEHRRRSSDQFRPIQTAFLEFSYDRAQDAPIGATSLELCARAMTLTTMPS